MRNSLLCTVLLLAARVAFPQTMNTLLLSGAKDSCLIDDIQKITFADTGSASTMHVYRISVGTGTVIIDSIRKIFFDLEGVVPVVLSSFSASYHGNEIVLNWTTQSEQNNLGWNVLRSTAYNGPFEKVNTSLVPGAGSTAQPNRYSWADETAVGSAYYYQLEQIDINSGKEYSWVVSATAAPAAIKEPRNMTVVGPGIYPNPASGAVNIHLAMETGGRVTVGVYDLTGSRLVKVIADTKLPPGRHTIRWDGLDGAGRIVENGTYILKINNGAALEIVKVSQLNGGVK